MSTGNINSKFKFRITDLRDTFRFHFRLFSLSTSCRPQLFFEKYVLKICSKFTGEHPFQNVISVKLPRNFIEVTLRHGFSRVNLLHIYRTTFLKNTYGWLLLTFRRGRCRPPECCSLSEKETMERIKLYNFPKFWLYPLLPSILKWDFLLFDCFLCYISL